MVHLDVKVDRRIHPRIIGAKGRGVRKIQDDFKVELRFPRQNDDPDIITISGNEDDVYDCKDHLLNIEEEFVSLSCIVAKSEFQIGLGWTLWLIITLTPYHSCPTN